MLGSHSFMNGFAETIARDAVPAGLAGPPGCATSLHAVSKSSESSKRRAGRRPAHNREEAAP